MYSYFVFKSGFTYLGMIIFCLQWKLVTRMTDQAANSNNATSVGRKLYQFMYNFDRLIQEAGYSQMENNTGERAVPDAAGPLKNRD